MTSWNELKDHIKTLPPSSIIGYYLKDLKKSGNYYKALCPFHGDSNPSLHVNDQKGLFMCFVCQTGGDAITFVEKYNNSSFIEALKDIAELLQLPVPKDNDKKNSNPHYPMALELTQLAKDLYKNCARNSQFSPIFQQFQKERSLSQETCETFELGLAPPTNILSYHLTKKPQAERKQYLTVAMNIGLVRNYNGQLYDTFRERIIFPIHGPTKNVLGFGAKATKDYQKGKYINSQESLIFSKKEILYGLPFAIDSIKKSKKIILVEGYMDFLALYEKGLHNAVAIMGVALGKGPLQLIKNINPEIYFALDNDQAGLMAREKINKTFLDHHLLCKHVDLSPHKDPDEFLNNLGAENFTKKMEKASTVLDIKIKEILSQEQPQTVEAKVDALNKIISELAPLGDSLVAKEKLLEASGTLGIQSGPDLVVETYENYLKEQTQSKGKPTFFKKEMAKSLKTRAQQRPRPSRPLQKSLSKDLTTTSEEAESLNVPKIEIQVLREIIHHPECMNLPEFSRLLDFIKYPSVKTMAQKLLELYMEVDEKEFLNFTMEFLGQTDLSMSIKESIGSSLFLGPSHKLDEQGAKKLIVDLIKKLRENYLKMQRQELKEQYKKSQTHQDSLLCIKAISEIDKELYELKTKTTFE